MDIPEEFAAVPLSAVLPVLAKSPRVRKVLQLLLPKDSQAEGLRMLQTDLLTGDVGNLVEDALVGEIENECETVWSGTRTTEDDAYPFAVNHYEGVYWVWAMDYENNGYFLTLADALSFINDNWSGEVEED